jgi:hypothetical protein
MQKFGHLKRIRLKGISLGIANPHIQTISLKRNEQFPSNTVDTEGPTLLDTLLSGLTRIRSASEWMCAMLATTLFKVACVMLPLGPRKSAENYTSDRGNAALGYDSFGAAHT